jgi:hypothetical protein
MNKPSTVLNDATIQFMDALIKFTQSRGKVPFEEVRRDALRIFYAAQREEGVDMKGLYEDMELYRQVHRLSVLFDVLDKMDAKLF